MAERVQQGIMRRGAQKVPDKAVEYKVGEETVKLSPAIIRNYLVSGNGEVTDQEVVMFLNLCRYQHLNPFLKEAYLIKFGNQPATMVVGKDAIVKRAFKNPRFEGLEAGIIILTADGQIEERDGAFALDDETIVAGWAKVHVKGYKVPVKAVAAFKEYVGLKKDGSINGQWQSKPATMIRKVALTQALREAFPEDLEGMYSSEEMNVDLDETIAATVQPEPVHEEPVQKPEPEQQAIDDINGLF